MGLIVRIKIQPALTGPRTGVKVKSRRVHARPSQSAVNRIRIAQVHRVVPNNRAVEIVENRSIVFHAQGPTITVIFSAQLDVIGLVVDRLSELGNVERAGASTEKSAKGSAPYVMILPIASGKRPFRCRRVTQVESRDAIIEAKVYRVRVAIQPLA